MNLIWGVILVLFTGVLGWLIQIINAFSPTVAAKLGLNEAESDVDPTFFVDTRGEAVWDAMIVWVLPLAGILLIMDNPLWAYFGLVGGGIYVYFAGRGIAVRLLMRRRNIRIGKRESIRLYYVYLAFSGLMAVLTIIMAVAALPLP